MPRGKPHPGYTVDPETGCWNWNGTLNGRGYPHGYQHRQYWERKHGPRPEGYDIHHLCRNTKCVNPDHLHAIDVRAHDIEHFLAEKGRSFDNIMLVRADRATGLSFRELATKYGLSYSTARRWCGNGLEAAWTDFVGERVEMPQPTCQAEDCDNPVGDEFGPGRRRKFCTPTCRTRHNSRKYRAQAKEAA